MVIATLHQNYLSKLNNRINYLKNNLADVKIENYLGVVDNLMYFYSGYLTGVNTLGLHRQPEISGNITKSKVIRNFTIRQPGAPGNLETIPLYDHTLGVLNYTISPEIVYRKWNKHTLKLNSYDRFSYKISKLPDGLIVNNQLNLNPNPRDVEISFNFMIFSQTDMGNIGDLDVTGTLFKELFADMHEHLNFIDYSEYRAVLSKLRKQFYAFTYFIAADDALGLVINPTRGVTIEKSTMLISIKATFDYYDTSKEPYIYLANYFADSYEESGSKRFPLSPTQMISNIFENRNEFDIYRSLDQKYVVDYGATLSINNTTFTKNTEIDHDQLFGFEIKNGTMSIENSNVNIDNARMLVLAPNSKVFITNAILAMDLSNIVVENGAKLYISNSEILSTSSSFILAKGVGSEIHLNNLSSPSILKNVQLIDGGKLFLDGSNVNITEGSITLSGSYSELILNNDSELYMSGSQSTLSVSNGAKVQVNDDSEIQVRDGSTLSLSNQSVVTVNNSRIFSNNESNIILSGSSKLSFENSSVFQTENHITITGHTGGLWFEHEEMDFGDGNGNSSLNIRGPLAMPETMAQGDRIEFSGFSRIDNIDPITITSGSDYQWDGLFFENCNKRNSTLTARNLRANISGISYIGVINSELYIFDSTITGIQQLFAISKSEIHLNNVNYSENKKGIFISGADRVSINTTTISENQTTGLIVENSPSLENDMFHNTISNNNGSGFEKLNSHMNIVNNTYVDNQYAGFRDMGNIISAFHAGTFIANNKYVDVMAKASSFPSFQYAPSSVMARPQVGYSPDSDNLYNNFFLYAIDVGSDRIDTGALAVDTTNTARFYPSKDAFKFNTILPFEIFYNAVARIETGDFEIARDLMIEIIEVYVDIEPGYARKALAFLPYFQKTLDTDPFELITYVNSLDNPHLETTKRETLAVLYLFNKEYFSAIEEYDYLIDHAESLMEQMVAELNKLYCEFQLSQMAGTLGVGDKTSITVLSYNQKQHEIYARMHDFLFGEGDAEDEVIPEVVLKLEGRNYPNPFNPETVIKFAIPESANVQINIYNIRGQRVKSLVNEYFVQGHHEIIWNGTNEHGQIVGSGVYFYRIQTEKESLTQRMLLLK
ncbi:MAG: T9SS type A sorting domain-containing protein [Candidatus Cloacimonetes bacterium]|nr:T9SS type A sorting domain-containing protein [Candidatus Cloacimonadota bacterium]